MADLDVQACRFQDAAAHLREGLQIVMRAGDRCDVAGNGLWACALLCTATRRYADAATLWAAQDVHARQQGFTSDARRCAQTGGSAEHDPAGAGPDRFRRPRSAARR